MVGCRVVWNSNEVVARATLATVSNRFFLRCARKAGIKNPALVQIKPQKTICFRPIHVGEI